MSSVPNRLWQGSRRKGVVNTVAIDIEIGVTTFISQPISAAAAYPPTTVDNPRVYIAMPVGGTIDATTQRQIGGLKVYVAPDGTMWLTGLLIGAAASSGTCIVKVYEL